MLKRPQDGGPIQDGFLMNPAWSLNPGRTQVLALGQLDTLRRANQLQPYWISLPVDGAAIQARDTYEYEAVVVPGSVLWGLLLSEVDASGTVTANSDALLRLTDACSGLEILNDFVYSRNFSNYYAGAATRGFLSPWLLPSPYMFVSPGRLFVEIANQSANAVNARLLLFFAQPCDMTGFVEVTR